MTSRTTREVRSSIIAVYNVFSSARTTPRVLWRVCVEDELAMAKLDIVACAGCHQRVWVSVPPRQPHSEQRLPPTPRRTAKQDAETGQD